MKLTIYRIFSFLLLPMAILFTIAVMLFLRAAFANTIMLIPLFFWACIAIYSFTSLSFLIKGIDGKKNLARSLKDWIIVNALVSLIYALCAIFQKGIFLFYPELIENAAKKMKENAGPESKATVDRIIWALNAASYFMLFYGTVLFVHIIMSFQYLRTYNYLFRNEKTGITE